jgi:hypothetical protein
LSLEYWQLSSSESSFFAARIKRRKPRKTTSRSVIWLATFACVAAPCCAADPQDLLTRIREHLREYVSQLPDYTCRVTIERSARAASRAPFQIRDRVRLEVVFSGGNELYAFPGGGRFERSISDILPAHGLVSDGSYALHMRTLFLRNAATFDEARRANGKLELKFDVPAARSGYAMTTPDGTVPAALSGTLWLDPDRLDVQKLEVHVNTRLGHSVEIVTYAREQIGDAEFVVPQTTDLVMLPEDGMQARNFSRFSDYHKFAGTSTLRFDNTDPASAASRPVPVPASLSPGRDFTAKLDAAIADDAAIGDPFTMTADTGAQYTGRITDMRRSGRDQWNIELFLMGRVIRKTVRFPLPAGMTLRFPAP